MAAWHPTCPPTRVSCVCPPSPQLLDWEVLGVTPYPASLFSPKPPSSVRLVVGDPWDKGATVQLQLPYQPR